jgi:hypothetical protein
VAVDRGNPGIYLIADDRPLEVCVWLPAYAQWNNSPPPLHVSVEETLRVSGADAVYYNTQIRGVSNAKAKRELNFQPRLLFAKDVTFCSDGGGKVIAAIKPIHGAMKVARILLAIRRKWLANAHVVSRLVEINGQPGIIQYLDGKIHSAITLEIVDGCIQSIYSVRNPEKLERIYREILLEEEQKSDR